MRVVIFGMIGFFLYIIFGDLLHRCGNKVALLLRVDRGDRKWVVSIRGFA